MKTLIVAALMASAAVAAPVTICTAGKVKGAVQLTDAHGTSQGCTWEGATATVSAIASSKSLVVAGGSTEGDVVIDLASRASPFALEVKGGLKLAGKLTIKGDLPKGSSVLVAGCAFDAKPTVDKTLLDLSALSIHASTLNVAGNTFDVDLKDVTGASATITCVALPALVDASTVAITGSVAKAVASGKEGALNLLQAAVATKFLNSAVTVLNNAISSKDADVEIGGVEIKADVPTAVSDVAPVAPAFDWSKVTDKQAREDYGKSSFTIVGNSFEAKANVAAWSITDGAGNDWAVKGNVAKSSGGTVSGGYTLGTPYYGISVSVAGNKLQAPAATMKSSISFDIAKVPSNSAVRADGNTLVSGETTSVAAFVLFGETWLPSGSDFVIMGNTLAAADGVKLPLAADQFVVDYKFGSAATTGSGPVALCGNTVFGNAINTDALVTQTVKNAGSALPVVKIGDCGAYHLRSAAPQRAAASAAGALASIAVAGAALLVL